MNTDIWVQLIASIEAIIVVLIPLIVSICGRKNAEKRIRKELIPYFQKATGDKSCEADINQILEQTIEKAKLSAYTSVYFRKYDATIKLYIDGDIIKVETAYTLCFVNPYRVDYTFMRKPQLRKGLQYDTYEWKNITYQGKPCNEYIHNYPVHMQETPNDRYLFKSGLEVPLVKEHTESVLHYSSEYISESAKFFHSYRFWHHCHMINIDVQLAGPSANQYEIQWEMFLSTNKKSTRFERSIHYNDPNHVCLSDGGWILPGDGYVITINKVS